MSPTVRLVLLVPLVLAACDEQGAAPGPATPIGAAKVEVCHLNNGAHEYALIDVAETSVDAHLAHGDTLFADDQDCDGAADWFHCEGISLRDLREATADVLPTATHAHLELYAVDETYDACTTADGRVMTGHRWEQGFELLVKDDTNGTFANVYAHSRDQEWSYADWPAWMEPNVIQWNFVGMSSTATGTIGDATAQSGPAVDQSACMDSMLAWAALHDVTVSTTTTYGMVCN